MPIIMRRILGRPKKGLASFTLIELLTVMAIILILAALTIGAGFGLMEKGKRSRASAEIQAMSLALEGYKTDNGIYPVGEGTQLLTNTPYTSLDGTDTAYKTNGSLVYIALSGQTNFTDTPVAGLKVYMSFKRNQVGDATGASYIMDPWQNSYGYNSGSTGTLTPKYPYNGSGFFDLWSTGGVSKAKLVTTPSLTNTWISNWQ